MPSPKLIFFHGGCAICSFIQDYMPARQVFLHQQDGNLLGFSNLPLKRRHRAPQGSSYLPPQELYTSSGDPQTTGSEWATGTTQRWLWNNLWKQKATALWPSKEQKIKLRMSPFFYKILFLVLGNMSPQKQRPRSFLSVFSLTLCHALCFSVFSQSLGVTQQTVTYFEEL